MRVKNTSYKYERVDRKIATVVSVHFVSAVEFQSLKVEFTFLKSIPLDLLTKMYFPDMWLSHEISFGCTRECSLLNKFQTTEPKSYNFQNFTLER